MYTTMTDILCLLFLFGLSSCYLQDTRFVTVNTSQGDIIGEKKFVSGKAIYSFLGIPYAQPPIGDLRFRNPRPLGKQKPYRATELPKACYQSLAEKYEKNNAAFRMWVTNTNMSEDCLYLNIWTPSIPIKNSYYGSSRYQGRYQGRLNHKRKRQAPYREKLKNPIISTMVWIHGNDFTSGSSTLETYNGEILASKTNVIVVSINYRLGALGFLFWNNSEEAPGNQGLMDQVMALTWINENIMNFGGNNKYITLFGSQSGAASAGLHLLSPKTQTLFNQVIMQGSTPLAWWAAGAPSETENSTKYLAYLSGCNGRGREMISCLRSLHPSTIIKNTGRLATLKRRDKVIYREELLLYLYKDEYLNFKINNSNKNFDIMFKPVYYTEYLPYHPHYYVSKKGMKKIKQRRVMMGVTKNQGILHMIKNLRSFFMPNGPYKIEEPRQFRSQLTRWDPLDIMAFYILNEEFLYKIIVQAVMFQYQIPSVFLNYQSWMPEVVAEAFDQVSGDCNFKCSVINFADFYHKINKVFMYSFEQVTKNLPLPPWTGVMMGQEIPYIFGKPFDTKFQRNYFNFTDEERELSLKMMKMWANFAQTGYPHSSMKDFNTRPKNMPWESYDVNKFNINRKHIIFSNNTISSSQNLRRRECLFWKNFISRMKKDLLRNDKCSRTKNVSETLSPSPTDDQQLYNKPQTNSKPSKPNIHNKQSQIDKSLDPDDYFNSKTRKSQQKPQKINEPHKHGNSIVIKNVVDQLICALLFLLLALLHLN